jgi:hypothetical protein
MCPAHQQHQALAHRGTIYTAKVVLIPGGAAKRCRLSWLTNSDLVYEPTYGGEGGGGARFLPMTTALHTGPDVLPILMQVKIRIRTTRNKAKLITNKY